jgi:hypothetical protein
MSTNLEQVFILNVASHLTSQFDVFLIAVALRPLNMSFFIRWYMHQHPLYA